jgi:NADPH:quinone reductase-like Zn-dependent oxidoreductase
MTLSHSMLAMEIVAPGGPDVLKPCAVPVPVPAHGQIVIRIAYAGVNRPDALQRAGAYAPPPEASPLPGLECSARWWRCGPGVTRWQIGDKVCALLPGGGYAEYAACHETHALPIPAGVSLREAACLPETCFHRLVQPGDARRAEGRGAVSGAWRHQRHRHHRDPDRPGAWRARLRHRRAATTNAGLPRPGRRTGDQLPRAGFRRT